MSLPLNRRCRTGNPYVPLPALRSYRPRSEETIEDQTNETIDVDWRQPRQEGRFIPTFFFSSSPTRTIACEQVSERQSTESLEVVRNHRKAETESMELHTQIDNSPNSKRTIIGEQ